MLHQRLLPRKGLPIGYILAGSKFRAGAGFLISWRREYISIFPALLGGIQKFSRLWGFCILRRGFESFRSLHFHHDSPTAVTMTVR